MPAEIHGVVQDSNDVDRGVENTVQDEMAAPPSLSRNVKRT
jgi:hypothetical protein